MILLFLSVWAIVIALNEVLFAAQPFSLTSVAAALPHTLMFSVVLSAAVYLAKKKIVDAIEKGQPIDKRFVADLTPEVGHELNNMRRKLASMDEKEAQAQARRLAAARRARAARAAARGRNFPSAKELAESKKQLLRQNRSTYNRMQASAQNAVRQEQLKKQKAAQKTQAKIARQEAKDARAHEALRQGKAAVEANDARNKNGLLSSMFGHHRDANEFVKDAHAEMLEQAQSQAEAQRRKLAAEQQRYSAKNNTGSKTDTKNQGQSAAAPQKTVSSVQSRVAERQEREKRRQAQIEALGEISSAEKARAQVQQKLDAKARKDKQTAQEKARREQEQQEQSSFDKLKHSLNPFADKDEVKARTSKMLQQSQARKEEAQKAQEAAQAEAVAKAKVAAKIREVNIARAEKAEAAQAFAREQAALQQEEQRQHERSMAGLQAQAHELAQKHTTEVELKNGAGVEFQGAEGVTAGNSNLDTTGLKRRHAPKQGAGLDTSALKKVTLPPQIDTGVSQFTFPQANIAAGNNAGGAHLLASNATQSSMNLKAPEHVGVMKNNAVGAGTVPDAKMAGAAYSTTLQNDGSLERGKANSLDFASYQANARARALERAQVPKASAQAQHIAATSNRPATSVARASRPPVNTAAEVTPNNSVSTARQSLGVKGPIGLGTAIPGLPSSHMGENGPVRKVVAGKTPQVAPSRDTLPKVRPDAGVAAIKTAPVMRSRRPISKDGRENLFKREVKFVDGTTPIADVNAIVAQNDRRHAQDHANAYSMMQKQSKAAAPATTGTTVVGTVGAGTAGAGADASKNHRPRVRPSDKLRTDEQV